MPKATEHLAFWVKTSNKAILKRIAQLTEAIVENPYHGIENPKL